MKTKIKDFLEKKLQVVADGIIEAMKQTKSDWEFWKLYEFGMRLDFWCTEKDIYLK